GAVSLMRRTAVCSAVAVVLMSSPFSLAIQLRIMCMVRFLRVLLFLCASCTCTSEPPQSKRLKTTARAAVDATLLSCFAGDCVARFYQRNIDEMLHQEPELKFVCSKHLADH